MSPSPPTYTHPTQRSCPRFNVFKYKLMAVWLRVQVLIQQKLEELYSVEVQLEQFNLYRSTSGIESQEFVEGIKSKTKTVEMAVADLVRQGQEGKLAGCFFGRLCNIARISHPEAAAAVNAVLLESCNLVCVTLQAWTVLLSLFTRNSRTEKLYCFLMCRAQHLLFQVGMWLYSWSITLRSIGWGLQLAGFWMKCIKSKRSKCL